MKRRLILIGGILALAVVLLVFWLQKDAKPSAPQSSVQVETNGLTEASKVVSTNAVAQPLDEKRVKAMRDAVLSQNIPISFWGKVVDQDNGPLEGVKVRLYTMRGNEYATGKFNYPIDYRDFTTSADGSFTLTDATGYTLTVEAIEKEGYRPEQLPKTFGYNGQRLVFIPESRNPVIFRMWKKEEPQTLVQAEKFYGIIPDGRAYTIDLLSGKKIEGESQQGDLQIKIQRPVGVGRKDKYNWLVDVSVIGGGVVETNDEFMYRAPETGYQPKFQLSMSQADPNWSHRVNKKFYVMSRNGQVYARLEVEVFSNYQNEAALGVRYFANPSGSRNLEYDPAKEIKPGKPR